MTATRIVFVRASRRARAVYATALATALFFLAAGAAFAFALAAADGTPAALAPLWTVSVARVLPLVAALLAMDAWSEERRTGFDEVLLATAVRERSLVLGKFLAAAAGTFAAVAGFLATTLLALRFLAPSVLAGVPLAAFLPGLFVLAVQGTLWCAITVMLSAMMRSSALVVLASLAVTALLPRAVWALLTRSGLAWGLFLGEAPFDAQAADLAEGVVSLGMLLAEAAVAFAALFVASKTLALGRFSGGRARWTRVSMRFTGFLALVVALLFALLLVRFDLSFDLPVGAETVRFSDRTRNILAEARGDVAVTAFVPRSDRAFRPAAQFLRSLAREARVSGGARFEIRFVDPHWDVSEAERLARAGVPSGSVVVAHGRRRVVLPVADGLGERVLASAVLNVTLPPQRRTVYWTVGHGEASFADYGLAGMSDLARELMRDGYANRTIDLSAEERFPADCALVVAAAPKNDFALAETARLDAYLKQGGRLAVLLDADSAAGFSGLLSSWGVRINARERLTSPLFASSFGPHAVSAPLAGSRVAFGRAFALQPSAAATGGTDADRISFAPLAFAGERILAALSERGTGAGDDTAIRPTRVAVFGDATFVMNASLKNLANANRDFFLNAVSYLAGSHALTAGGPDGNVLATGLDPSGRVRFAAITVAGVPLAILALFVLWVRLRRRR